MSQFITDIMTSALHSPRPSLNVFFPLENDIRQPLLPSQVHNSTNHVFHVQAGSLGTLELHAVCVCNYYRVTQRIA